MIIFNSNIKIMATKIMAKREKIHNLHIGQLGLSGKDKYIKTSISKDSK